MYNFAQKTQSIWFISYAAALFLALATVLEVFDFLSIPNVTPYEVLLYSGILFAIGTGFGLGALESGERRLFWKWSLLWLVFILSGLILTLSGIYASFLDPKVMFGDKPATLLFVIGTPLLVYGTILFFSGMSEETKDAFGRLWIVYLLFLLISLIFGFSGFGLFYATTGGRNPINSVPGWDVMTEVAIVFGVLSIIPFGYVMGARESLKEKFHKGWLLWALLSVAGLVLFGLSVAEILSNVDIVGGASHRQGGLILGLAFQAPGFVFLLASTDKTDLIKKLSPLWVLTILAGLVLTFASQLATSLSNSTLGAGLGLVIIAGGLLYKAISVDYTPTSTATVARPSRTAASVSVSSKVGFDVPNDLPVEEKKIYIEMQRKTNENTIVSLNNYGKQNRLSKDFVTRKVQELQSVNTQAESLIASIVEEAKRSSRASLFEQAMGTETPSQPAQPQTMSRQPPPMSPPGPPSSPPAPINAPASKPSAPSGPPMPPPSSSGPPKPPTPSGPPPSSGFGGAAGGPPKPPGMPPMPPSSGAPPSPPGFGGAAGGPPKPPGMPPMPPGAAPPVPGGAVAPKAPGAPSGDAVGTARSTSIAELRGEMLKELRRLRDIFNEDQK